MAVAGAPASLQNYPGCGDGAAPTGVAAVTSVQCLRDWGIFVRHCPVPVEGVCSARKYISERYHDTPSVVKSLELLRICGLNERVLVITASTVLDNQMSTLRRWYPHLVVGSLKQHEWMVGALDIVLGTPEEACAYETSGQVSSSHTFVALILDNVSSVTSELLMDVMSLYSHVIDGPSFPLQVVREVSCLVNPRPCMDNKFRAIVQEHLPEAEACPAFGDATFCEITHGLSSMVVKDWSGVLACIPSFVRNENSTSSCALLLAPEHRVVQFKKLLDEFLQYMDCKSSDVLVGTPGSFVNMELRDVRRVLIVEAGKLLASEVRAVLYRYRDARIVVHSPSEDLQDIVLDWGCRRIRQAGVTIEYVGQYHQVVTKEEEKVEHVCRIWEQLLRRHKRLVVFSDEPHKVGDALRLRGVKVRVTDKEMDAEVVEELERDYLCHIGLLVTNRYFRSIRLVINLDLPLSASDYLERCGVDRNVRMKVVINVVTPKELSALEEFLERLHCSTMPLPAKCQRLWSEYVKSRI